MVRVALAVKLEAKPGKEAEVAAFLKSGLALANQEPATAVWFALQFGPSTFGIFDAFPDDAGRQAHLAGPIAAALMAKAKDLLASPPSIEKVDILAAKIA
jgi:quinol monooxygenase YgiN